MTPGTATITSYCGRYVVQYARIGSGLHCQPMFFRTEAQAKAFCREYYLTVLV